MPTSLMRRVPYLDIARQHQPLKRQLLDAVAAVIDHGQFILGEEVASFEQRFATLCGVRFAVGVNSGTDALLLALRVLGIGPGDEVITVPNSFVATASAIRLVGATPVFVDVCDDYNIDPEQILPAITARTKAILPVHLTGRSSRMDIIVEIASKMGLAVIEDAAQAVLAEYQGRRVGSFGTIGCFSLHPLKTLNACGDGGVLTTNNQVLYEKLLIERNLGLRTRDDCVSWAHNSRLDTIQAAMLLVKLQYVEQWTEARRAHARYYQSHLSSLQSVRVPVDSDWERPAYHTFVIRVHSRDKLRAHLASMGIGTAIHYPVPIHLSTIGRELGYKEGTFPVAERQAKEILSLPVYPELERSDLEYIATTILDYYAH